MPEETEAENRAWEQREWAARIAAAKQQEAVAEQERQLGAAAAAEAQAQPLRAKEAQLKKRTVSSYVPVYFGLTFFASMIDLLAAFNFTGLLALVVSTFGLIFSFFRFMALHRVNQDSTRAQTSRRNLRTVLGAIFELIPFVNIMPVATALMIWESYAKRSEISEADRELHTVRGQLKKLAALR